MTMMDLTPFDVNTSTGFLPPTLPLERLPAYFDAWEQLAAVVPSLILSKMVRKHISKMPLLSTDHLTSLEERRRAYSVLGFLTHAYIWSGDEPESKLPGQLAIPLESVAKMLRLPPLATYAGLCLWNFKQTIPSDDIWDLDNLTTINTFTGSIDELWFYLVSVFFEYRSGQSISLGLQILDDIAANDIQNLTTHLQALAETIDALGSVLMKMEERCDPHVFYFRIRPFLAGWRNMSEVGLEGVFYGDDKTPRTYAGGSNAQSSAIQFLDVLLGVKHVPTGERKRSYHEMDKGKQEPTAPAKSFMDEMREYMPGPHSDFLREIETRSTVREYVLSQDALELTLAYDACLAMLKLFRDKHIQIVTRYIVLQAKKGAKMGSSGTKRSGLARSSAKQQKGTGGTALLPFLKQCRDETGDPAAGSWGKRILSDGVMRLGYSRANGVNEDDD